MMDERGYVMVIEHRKRLMAVVWLEEDDEKRTWVRGRYMHGSA